jgi:hypothetical protein
MPVSQRIQAERQLRHDRRMAEAKLNVPEGDYCYGHTGRMIETDLPGGAKAKVPEARLCPYWKRRGDKPEQANGYCRLMKAGDWMPQRLRTVLLWDQVKECDINHYPEDIE